jgi:hypothetical protein
LSNALRRVCVKASIGNRAFSLEKDVIVARLMDGIMVDRLKSVENMSLIAGTGILYARAVARIEPAEHP